MKTLPVLRLAGRIALAALAIPAAHASAHASAQVASIADLDLEQLTQITVTSASRREERVIEAPASIFVLTAEDIRRSGATSLPEVLRLAPNLQVARADTSQYVISARGGLSGTANKMLVLIDGRTVYTPLFAGVFWDAQNVMIEDLERVEVISGPGSTLWGTNAVNGVINIITKSAARTTGTLASAVGGDQEKGVSVRTGGALGQGFYRVYAKYFDRDSHYLASGAPARDAAERWQVGFRTDLDRAQSSFTVQGDLYEGRVDNLGGFRPMSGANVLGRWRLRSPGTEVMVQAYLDRTEREHEGSFKEIRDTVDLEFQQAFKRPGREVVWGGGYRASRDRTEATPVLAFMPAGRTLEMTNLFLQAEAEMRPAFRATLGIRAERNDYTGVEWLPNARLQWLPSPDHVLWTALSRAVRQPSRIDRDLYVPGMPPFTVYGNDTYGSEIANVAELGYRAQLMPGASISLTAFHHQFRDLRTLEISGPGVQIANGAEGRVSGVEGWADFALARNWRLVGGFTWMNEKFELKPGHVDLGAPSLGNDPRRAATLRSLWSVTRSHELDLAVRHVGELPNPAVPAYTVLDARLGWRAAPQVEVSLLVGNALNRKHAEFGGPGERAILERTVHLRVTFADKP